MATFGVPAAALDSKLGNNVDSVIYPGRLGHHQIAANQAIATRGFTNASAQPSASLTSPPRACGGFFSADESSAEAEHVPDELRSFLSAKKKGYRASPFTPRPTAKIDVSLTMCGNVAVGDRGLPADCKFRRSCRQAEVAK